MRDRVYRKEKDIVDFIFDKKIVKVFDDMVLRSVPGYKLMIELIGLAGRTYPTENSNIYDLGCSTGAATLAVVSNLQSTSVEIFSVVLIEPGILSEEIGLISVSTSEDKFMIASPRLKRSTR